VTDTGRIAGTLGARTRRVVYGDQGPEAIRQELEPTSTIDLAHVVMLAEVGLLPLPAAAALLTRIRDLRASGFRELSGRDAPRGAYLMYEGYLVDELGADTGGRLHTGRSRNDLKATITAIRLRGELTGLIGELLRLQAALLSRARIHRDTVMPAYTHFQPAMPVSYGYYLAGVAAALERDVGALRYAVGDLRRCPLGASAVAGTDLPIRPERTAALLGFAEPPLHATDAVAARDIVLRALATAASAGITLSRLATDLQLWSTQEFGFIAFPDRLVGGSSAMPQKRNAFLLEHVKAKAATAVGAWTAAASAMRSTPFTNSIEVGTVAVDAAWPGLAAVLDAVLLAQVLVTGARPDPARMWRRAGEGFVTATFIANQLVAHGVPFRTAHHAVGAAVRQAIESGRSELTAVTLPDGPPGEPGIQVPALPEVVARHDRGGGPGGCDKIAGTLRQALQEQSGWLAAFRDHLDDAAADLAGAVDAVLAGHLAGGTG
jgi:argininosuccinate lyase